MQQPGPATKGNRVRQLHISRGSSPLTQPLISLAAAAQSPYLYLPGISVHTAERGGGEEGGYVKAAGSEWSAFFHPRFPGTLHASRTLRAALSPSKTSSLSACEGWQVCFLQNALKQVYTRSYRRVHSL